MKISRIASLLVLIFLFTSSAKEEKALIGHLSTMVPNQVVAQGDVFPVMRFPDKGRFVTTEEDPFLINIEALCAPGTPNTAQFELLPPTPGFVSFFDTCRGNALSHAMIAIAPRRGDAGKYTVAIRAINCAGEGGTFTFTVKVKRL